MPHNIGDRRLSVIGGNGGNGGNDGFFICSAVTNYEHAVTAVVSIATAITMPTIIYWILPPRLERISGVTVPSL